MASGGGKAVQWLVLLVIVGGAGGWNYQRNAEVEAAEPRPYRAYSDADLDQLITAYDGETARHSERYQRVASRPVTVRERGMLGEQVSEFERVQRLNSQRRELAGRVADNQTALAHLETEKQKREADRPIYKLIFRRLFTFREV